MTGPSFSRRRALTGTISVGLALPILSGCGGDEPAASPRATDPASSADSSESGPSESETPAEDDPLRGDLAATEEIPVGGGLIVGDGAVVITQPSAGEFKGFSATCTHSGCLVNEVSETIDCPCHGSTFSVETGEPTGGPASAPLSEMPLQVRGGRISLA